RWRRPSSPGRGRTRSWCGATARTSGAPTGSPRRRTRSATTISSVLPWRCGAPEFRRSCREEPTMRAYRLEEPEQRIAPEELATHGVMSWSVPSDEPARAAILDALKREPGYVDGDFIELGPAPPK